MARKEMAPRDWVALAATTDWDRPTLRGVHVTPDCVEATDGFRVHRWSTTESGLQPGLWDAKTGDRIDTQYPVINNVMSTNAHTHEITDVDEFAAVVAAAVAYAKVVHRMLSPHHHYPTVTFRTADGVAKVNALYVADMLRGQIPGGRVCVTATKWSDPVRFDMAPGAPTGTRTVLIMTIRADDLDGHKLDARFDVSETMSPIFAAGRVAS